MLIMDMCSDSASEEEPYEAHVFYIVHHDDDDDSYITHYIVSVVGMCILNT